VGKFGLLGREEGLPKQRLEAAFLEKNSKEVVLLQLGWGEKQPGVDLGGLDGEKRCAACQSLVTQGGED
jgi:hypothetical protein